MEKRALIYCENEFGKVDGKVANGLVRHSETYKVVGIIDSSIAGLDAGEFLDGKKNGIEIFKSLFEATEQLKYVPEYFIYGVAPIQPFLNWEQRKVIFIAMKLGMDIINGLPEFLTEDEEFIKKANEYNVTVYDIRKPPKRENLHSYTGKIFNNKTPVICVLGTDCAVGKRTTAIQLFQALRKSGLKVVFIATGQTGILQGFKYGIPVDVLSSGFASGEIEHAILTAVKNEKPDIIIVEGQGALSHPAFTSSCAILKGAHPDAVILQHSPLRVNICDFPHIPMPSLESEIELIETFSNTKVIAVTLNHEFMADFELKKQINNYEFHLELPVTDVLLYGSDKLVKKIFEIFPKLKKQAENRCLHQE